MRKPHSVVRLAFALAMVIGATAAVGCGQWTPPAPTAPSQFRNTPASGAVISGTVNGGAHGLQPATWSSGPGLTVTIVGTTIAAPVSASGTFTLTGVPTGDIVLQFTGAGVSATVTVRQVQDRQQVDISVTITGSTATVTSIFKVDVEHHVEIEGEVTQISGACPSLVVVVHGTAIALNASTQSLCATIKIGVKIKIEGELSSGNVILVVKMEVENENEQGDDDDHDH